MRAIFVIFTWVLHSLSVRVVRFLFFLARFCVPSGYDDHKKTTSVRRYGDELMIYIHRYNKHIRDCARMGSGEWNTCYLRPVSGCIRPWCVLGVTFALAGCFGLLTFVLLLANSSRMVCGMSGSNRTPCCRNQTHNNTVLPSRVVVRGNTNSAANRRRARARGKNNYLANVLRWKTSDVSTHITIARCLSTKSFRQFFPRV